MSEKPITCNPHTIWKNAKDIVENSQMSLLGYFKTVLETCFSPDGGVKKGTSTKKMGAKRRPSGYNLFIGNCMGTDGKPMKQCAADWKNANKDKWNEKAKGG